MINIVHNADCLPAMRKMKDNQFDLAIVDPPYGLDITNIWGKEKYGYKEWEKKDWDKNVPDENFFMELFRVSKNQIIWGGNYYKLEPTAGWIIWDKGQRDFTLADGEMAWTSFNKAMRIFDYSRAEANKQFRIHPTQKPIKLYKWLLKNYAKENDTILDTHVGSGSSRIACWEMGFDFTGYEIDKDYWEAQEKRFKIVKNQQTLF